MRISNKLSNKTILGIAWGSFAAITLGAMIIPSFTPEETKAATQIDASIHKTGYYLNLSSTASSINMDVTPSTDGTLASAKDSLNIKTNIPSGYNLYISATSGGAVQNSLYNSITKPGESPASITASTATPATATTLTNNTWGFGIPTGTEGLVANQFTDATSYSTPTPSSEAHWAGIPAKGSGSVPSYARLIQTINHNNDYTEGNNLDIYYGTKINSSLPSGLYTGNVVYTAIADEPPKPDIYIVHYDANGGSGVPEDQEHQAEPSFDVESAYTFQLTDNGTIPTRDGYTFGGWTEHAGNQAGAYSPGSDIYLKHTDDPETDRSEVILYAIWVPNSEMGFGSLTGDNAKMQNMTSSVCAGVTTVGETGRLQDSRDYKVYYVTKEADGHCWMTQNLSLDIRTRDSEGNLYKYTSADTDITNGIEWKPGESSSLYKNTIPAGNLVGDVTWQNDPSHPYSFNSADSYITSSGTTADDPETPTGNPHYTVGNSYNWSAAVASNDTSSYTTRYDNAPNSICPKGWKLPQTYSNSEYGQLLASAGIISSATAESTGYASQDGFNKIRTAPLYWVRSGTISASGHNHIGENGYYWTTTIRSDVLVYGAYFDKLAISARSPLSYDGRASGLSVRCLAR